MNTTSTCPACAAFARMGLQCMKHTRTAPNANTLAQRSMVAMMRETGCTAAEAEQAHGVTIGQHVTIG